MVKAVHWIWVVTSLWLTGYAHALAWDELTPFEVSASTPIIAAPSNNVSAQGVVTRYKASRCRLGYQSSIEDKDKPKVQTIAYQAGDTFAIVTDGLTDQVGGPDVIKKTACALPKRLPMPYMRTMLCGKAPRVAETM